MVIPFILPAFLVYSVFFVYPALQALWVSLFRWSGFGANMVYIGFGNYAEILHDPIFWDALKRTLIIALPGGAVLFVLAIFFAAILRRNLHGAKFFRAVLFFPMVIPGIGIGLIWFFVYNYDWGPLSALLKAVHLDSLNRPWLGPSTIIESMTVAIIWSYIGYYVVILLAGMDKVPPTYYEAGVVDGAGPWRMFFSITLPLIWDVVVVALILWLIGSLKIFDIIVATTFPQPPISTYTLTVYIWTQASGIYEPVFRLGYATAMGVVLTVLVVLSVAAVRFLTRREAVEY
jgi:ABC-type sugar transport system permease subunit